MVDFIELAVYGERVMVGGIEMITDEDGNMYSLENVEDRLREMLPGANLTKRLHPRKKVHTEFRNAEKEVLHIPPLPPVTPTLQPGTFLRPVLGNPYVETKS